MAIVTVTTDTLFYIFNTTIPTRIGLRSIYANQATPHPGTGEIIKGWEWDRRPWSTTEELEAASFAPSLWDPTFSGLESSLLQSGFGDNKDLLLLDVIDVQVSGEERWEPKINHGFFYSDRDEWFLFADGYQTEYFTLSNTISGQQFTDLRYDYKPTNPIQVRQYSFDKIDGRYNINLDFRKVVTFTVSGAETPEFLVDTDSSPPRVFLDKIYNEAIGVPVTVSGNLLQLEEIGVSNGEPGQEFSLQFSPLDSFEPVEIWSWSEPTLGTATQWTTISGAEEFGVGDIPEARVDYDLGRVSFGDFDGTIGSGRIPLIGNRIGAYYTKAVGIQYEPKDTRDYIVPHAFESNINPIASSTNRGFVQVAVEATDPEIIVLVADLPKVNPFLIELGNNVGVLTATVKNKAGATLEGIQVTFEILAPIVGSFGPTDTQITALTDGIGESKTNYNSPTTVLGVGKASTNVTFAGSDTIIDIVGLTDPGDVERFFLYKVHVTDEVLGIPASGVDQYYTDYLATEDITEDPDGTSATQVFEQDYRLRSDLPVPATYDTTEISVGKKTIVLTTKVAADNVIETKTGKLDGGTSGPTTNPPVDQLSALFPDTIINIGTDESPVIRASYIGTTLDAPGTGDTKAYFAVGDVQTRVRAFVTNQRTNRKVFSNTIELKVTVPDSANGTFLCTALSALPQIMIDSLLNRVRNIDDISDKNILATQEITSFNRDYVDEQIIDVTISGVETYVTWFRRTRRADTQGLIIAQAASEYLGASPSGASGALGPEAIELLACGEIPLGFRLKSTGITVASVLDQITFLDPNDHLGEDYFSIKSNVSDLGHSFTVASII